MTGATLMENKKVTEMLINALFIVTNSLLPEKTILYDAIVS